MSQPETTEPNKDRFAWRISAKALYLQGVPTKEIAAQLGVSHDNLRQWISREKLSQARQAVKSAVISHQITVTKSAVQAATIAAKDSLRPMLHELSKELLDSQPLKRKPRTLREVEQLARVHNTVTQSVRLQEGWQDTTEHSINVHLIHDGLSELDPDVVPPAIDVETVQQS